MPQTQVQILRSSISGARPAAGSQAPGVLYTNFADKQLGVILPDGTALDLIPTASSLLSTDAGNASALGSDGLIYTPTVIGGAATVSDIPPADPVQGMFWFNTTDGFLYIYYDDGSSAQWVSIASNGGGGGSAGGAGLHMGDAPPADPAAFPLWWNSANGFLYVFYNDGDSSQWVSVTGNGGASSGGSSTGAGLHMGDAPPADPAAYPFWWNSTDGLLYVYYDDGNSAQWVSTSSSGGGSGGASSGLFFGENPPINTLEYSFWYNTANGQLHVWYEDADSSQWVSVTGSGGGSGGGSSLVSSVNGKIGEVVLNFTDVGAAPAIHSHDYPVDSVNGMTGAVVIPPYVLPAATEASLGGVMLGPVLYASVASAQTVTNNTFTKVTMTNVAVDSASAFSNSRFQPKTAGYYLVTIGIFASGATNTNLVEGVVHKNGTPSIGGSLVYSLNAYVSAKSNVAGIVYMNGTTDYIETYARVVGSGALSINEGFIQCVYLRS